MHRDPEEIATGLGNYFCELYSDTERSLFDPLFKSIINSRADNILQELSYTPTLLLIILRTILSLKTKKACGKDGVYNEHLLHGGDTLCSELSVLFTDM